MSVVDSFHALLVKYSLVAAFAVVGAIIWASYFLSDRLTRGRLHGSAIAILTRACVGLCWRNTHGGHEGDR